MVGRRTVKWKHRKHRKPWKTYERRVTDAWKTWEDWKQSWKRRLQWTLIGRWLDAIAAIASFCWIAYSPGFVWRLDFFKSLGVVQQGFNSIAEH
jgi:TctA family transporter